MCRALSYHAVDFLHLEVGPWMIGIASTSKMLSSRGPVRRISFIVRWWNADTYLFVHNRHTVYAIFRPPNKLDYS